MWQLDRAATSASSGSTASARESGRRTDSGEDEAGTVTPPSNDHGGARLNLLSVNGSLAAALPRDRRRVFVCHDRSSSSAYDACFTKAS